MAVLSDKTRDDLPKAVFGLPGKRAYPMPDREHAIDAKARAKEEYEAGKLTKGEYEHIITMANEMIAKYSSNG